jgi:hypothetical protein
MKELVDTIKRYDDGNLKIMKINIFQLNEILKRESEGCVEAKNKPFSK